MLKEKLRTRQANISVTGLGYVGLRLAVEFARNAGEWIKNKNICRL
jgi:UDP-N-acetyl-D-mannosaminuronate dehydrogenase